MIVTLAVLAVLATSPAPDFTTRVEDAVASFPAKADLREVRRSFHGMHASNYMQRRAEHQKPGFDELDRWVDKNPTLAGLTLAKEVASGWASFTPSPVETFPAGTPPAVIAEKQKLEREGWIQAVMNGLARSRHALASEAIWVAMNGPDTPKSVAASGWVLIAAAGHANAVAFLRPCIGDPKLDEKAVRDRCSTTLGATKTPEAAKALVELAGDPDSVTRRLAIRGLGMVSKTALLGPKTANPQREAYRAANDWLVAALVDPKRDPREADLVAEELKYRYRTEIKLLLEPELAKNPPAAIRERIDAILAKAIDDPKRLNSSGGRSGY